jgi:hypothetical protein
VDYRLLSHLVPLVTHGPIGRPKAIELRVHAGAISQRVRSQRIAWISGSVTGGNFSPVVASQGEQQNER